MDSWGLDERGFVRSAFGPEDREALAEADLVVLAGGDPVRGWRVFEQTGLGDALRERREQGAVILGVSAGAVQMGWLAAPEVAPGALPEPEATVIPFRFVPGIVGVHEERDDWRTLRHLARHGGLRIPAFGIPAGGGLVVHPDGTLEALRQPVLELSAGSEGLTETLLLPAIVPQIAVARTS